MGDFMLAIYMIIMAVTTYLIRMLPLTLFRRPINQPHIKSFLHLMPYACLSAMTVPAIFYCTSQRISAIIGFGIALLLGWRGRSLPVVAALACITVAIVEAF
jgi:branched-subunit amino acid transport protein